jgi:hypothetical protein
MGLFKMNFGWFKKKKKAGITKDFANELLPIINNATRDVQIVVHRCRRIAKKDTQDLSIQELLIHISYMESALDYVESNLRHCHNLIVQEKKSGV